MMTRTDRHMLPLIPLLLLSLAACGGSVDEEFLTGTWAHTRQVEVTDPITGRPVGTLRSDEIIFSDLNRYTREYRSNIPGEEEQFSHEGRWYIRGRTLKLTFTKQDSSFGKVKGKIQVIDEYSIRLDNRFYSKDGRPRNQRPEREP